VLLEMAKNVLEVKLYIKEFHSVIFNHSDPPLFIAEQKTDEMIY
jgi:hypothetical protein